MKHIALFLLMVLAGVIVASPVRSSLSSKGIYYTSSADRQLPDGLIAVKYIESTGTQWIQTQFYFQSRTNIVADLTWENENMGSDGGFWGVNGIFQFRYLYTYNIGRCICRCYRNGAEGLYNYVNGVLKEKNNYWNYKGYLRLFYMSGGNAGSPTKTRVYWIRFLVNEEVYYDMIPVRFLNENKEQEGAMYDTVSGQLFRNQGTGAFGIGPDKE